MRYEGRKALPKIEEAGDERFADNARILAQIHTKIQLRRKNLAFFVAYF
jgi:hypothetical protein